MNYLQNHLYNYLDDVSGLLVDYVDVEFGRWLMWLLTPVIVTFLLPAVLVLLIYTSAVIFHVYRLYRRLRLAEGVQGDWRNAARLAVCALWDAHGWLWHGYDISGLENIPDGPCLFIYYHGALPVDMYYFIGRMYLLRRKLVHTVADRFMFKIPGWSIALDNLCVIPGTVQSCSGILRGGNQLAISPGGVYEAQFGDHYYQLNWKARIGFAKVALEAKVPIVPLFTQNVREAFRTVGWLRWLWLRIYSATRVPLAPVYGGFPVKLTTHVGAPIRHDPTLTPQQLQLKVARAIEELVEEHQRVPGSILRALIERVYRVPKKPRRPAKVANGSCSNGTIPNTLDRETNVREEEIRASEKYVDRNELTASRVTENGTVADVIADKEKDAGNAGDRTDKLKNGKESAVDDSVTAEDVTIDDRNKMTEDEDKLLDGVGKLSKDKVSDDILKVIDIKVTNEKERMTYVKDRASDVVSNIISELIDKVTEMTDRGSDVSVFHERNVGDSKMKVS